jgi:hypothetical protein
VLTAGCVGLIGDADKEGGQDGQSPSDVASVGGYHMMRLTSAEYDNTVRDLLGDTTAPASTFSPDEKVGPFDANVLAPPSEVMLEDYMHAAEALEDRMRYLLHGAEFVAVAFEAAAVRFQRILLL